MFTRNAYICFMPSRYSGRTYQVNGEGPRSAFSTKNSEAFNGWFSFSFNSVMDQVTTPTTPNPINQSEIALPNSSYRHCGIIPMEEDVTEDLQLKYITKPNILKQFDNDVDGSGPTITRSVSLSNTGTENINVKSLAFICAGGSSFYTTTSNSGCPFIIAYTNLDTPVTVEPGQSKIFTYTLDFINFLDKVN